MSRLFLYNGPSSNNEDWIAPGDVENNKKGKVSNEVNNKYNNKCVNESGNGKI